MEHTQGIMLLEEIEPGKLEFRELIESLLLPDNVALVQISKLNSLIKDFSLIHKSKKEQAQVDLGKIQAQVTSIEYLVAVRSYFQINETSKVLENFDTKKFFITCDFDQIDSLFGQGHLEYLEAKSNIQDCWHSDKSLEVNIVVKLSNRLLKKNID